MKPVPEHKVLCGVTSFTSFHFRILFIFSFPLSFLLLLFLKDNKEKWLELRTVIH